MAKRSQELKAQDCFDSLINGQFKQLAEQLKRVSIQDVIDYGKSYEIDNETVLKVLSYKKGGKK